MQCVSNLRRKYMVSSPSSGRSYSIDIYMLRQRWVQYNIRKETPAQDVRDASIMEYLLRRAANREWNQPKREKYVVVNKAERS